MSITAIKNPAKVLERLSELSLWIFSFVLFMSKPWESTLQAMDSSIHARLALEVTRNGLIPALPMPNLNLDTGAPFFNDHPFTLFYLVGHFMRTFGADAWGARFIPSLFGVFCVAMAYRIGKKYFSPVAGYFAALALLITQMWIQYSARFQLDPAMCFFILVSFYFWMNKETYRNAIFAGLSVGLAVAFKSPVGFLLIPCSVIVDFFLQRAMALNYFLRFLLLLASSLIAPIMVWGIATRVAGDATLLLDYVQRQVLGTAIQGRNSAQDFHFFSFLEVLWNSNRVFAISLILALTQAGKLRNLIRTRNLQLIISAAVVVVVVISSMRFKFPHYFLPAFPFLALLVGVLAAEFFKKEKIVFVFKIQKFLMGIALIAPLALLILPIPTAPESFPALKNFIPYIQSYGKSDDRILFIQHLQPYGSEGDYFTELAFYTGNKFMSSDCAHAEEKVLVQNPEWILTSGEKTPECISEKLMIQYPFKLKSGNQFLFGRNPAQENVIFDLTPLYRGLMAPIDGKESDFPHSIYYRY